MELDILRKRHFKRLSTKRYKKFGKKALSLFLTFIVVLTGTGLLYLFGPWTKTAEAAWFNDDWKFRQEVPITANTGADTNTFISFSLDTATLITAGKLQSSCQDIRVTDLGGNILAYHVGRTNACNNAATTIDALVPTLAAGASTFYVYYGNPSVSSADTGALSQSEAASYTVGTLGAAVVAPSPILYWKFDDATGTNAEDATANALDGTLNNTPTWQTENMCIASKCIYFDGSNNENVSKADNGLLDFVAADNFTVSAWVKRNGASSANNFILTKAQSGYTGYKLYQDASGDYCFDVSDGTNTDTACTSAVEFDDDKWHFVAGVKNGTTAITLYIDGIQRATDASIAATGTLVNTGTFYTGVDLDGTSNEWLGFIDEVKVFRDQTTRTAAQVAADFNARSNPEGVALNIANAQNQPAALSNGLVGYWKMDESTYTGDCSASDLADSSGNGNSGKICPNGSGATVTAGKFGNGTDFDDSDDYAETTSSPFDPDTTEFSAAVWFNSDNLTSATNDTIIAQADGTGQGRNWLQVASTTTDTVSSSLGNVTTDSNFTPTAGTWTHAVVVKKGTDTGATNTIQVYVNGELKATSTDVDVESATGVFRIGVSRTNGQYFNGKLDEIRVYKRTLSPADISTLYNFAPGPIGYWHFNEKTGTASEDASGNGNQATLTNTPTWTTGKYGGAINFAGSNQHVIRADDSDFDFGTAASFTYGAWVKHTASPGTVERIVTKYDATAGNGGFALQMETDGDLTCGIDDDEASFPEDSATSTAATYDDNLWHFVTCVKDGTSSLKLYIDGVLITNNSSITSTGDFANADPLYIGIAEDGTSNDWIGQIDEPKIYNYARTSGQVVEDMNAGHPAPGSPIGSPMGFWKFDEGADNTCSGGSNDVCNAGNGGSSLDGTSSADRTNIAKYGKSLSFNGSDDVVTIANSNPIDMDTNLANFTYTAWVYAETDGEGDTGQIFNKSTAGGDGTYLRVDTQDASGNLDLEANLDLATTDANVNVADALTMNSWNYVAMSWDGTTLRVFVNGYEKGSGTGSGAISADTFDLLIGGGTGDNFDGKIDEFRVYNQALTGTQILVDMQRAASQTLGALTTNSKNEDKQVPIDPSTISNLKLWLKADAISSTDGTAISTWSDSSGTGNDATQATGANQPIYRTNIINGMPAVDFDGSNDRMAVTTTGFPSGNADFTMIGVHLPVSASDKRVFVFGQSTAGTRTNAVMTVLDGNTFENSIGSTGSDLDWDLPTNTTSNNIRTAPVVQTFRYTASSLLMEGFAPVQNTSSSTTLNGSASLSTSLARLGSNSSSNANFYEGYIAEFILYSSAITDAQRIGIEAYLMQKYGLLPNVNSSAAEYCQPGENEGCLSPIGEWKLEETTGTTVYDTSGRGNTGTWNGTGTHFVRGKFGRGAGLNGTDDYISLGDMASTESVKALTWTFWIKPDTLATNMCIICKYNSDTTQTSWRIQTGATNSDALLVAIPTSTTSSSETAETAAGTLTAGQWHFVAVVFDGQNGTNADRIEIYVNGVYQSKTVTGTIPGSTQATTSNATIGAYSNGTTGFFDGTVDNMRIYNFRKRPPELGWEYLQGKPSHHWKMDDCQGSTVNDSAYGPNGSGGGQSGTINLGASGITTVGTCSTSSTAWGNGATGKYNYSLDLDGTDDYINVATPALPTKEFTYSAWVKWDNSGSTNSTLFMAADGAGGNEIRVWISDTDSQIRFTTNNTSNVTSTSTVTSGSWTHLTFIRVTNGPGDTPGAKYIYFNGVQDASTGSDGTGLNFSTCDFLIGVDADASCTGTLTEYFNGQIDDIRIYPYALSPYQVKQLYNEGAAVRFGPTTGAP